MADYLTLSKSVKSPKAANCHNLLPARNGKFIECPHLSHIYTLLGTHNISCLFVEKLAASGCYCGMATSDAGAGAACFGLVACEGSRLET